MAATVIFPLALWLSGTNQNSTPANDNALRLQALMAPALAIANTAPTTPADNAQYIVGTAWGGMTSKSIVIYKSGTWYEFAPVDGLLKDVAGTMYRYNSGAWAPYSSSGVVENIVAGSGITVDDSDPANPIVSATGGGGGTGLAVTDPAGLWFGPSGVTLDSVTSYISGDPFVVWDGTQWVMFFFRTLAGGPPFVAIYYRTAPTLEGPWSSASTLTGLSTYHKFVVLVDEDGAPVLDGGVYHGYAVLFTGTSGSKEIFHFTAAALTGTWTMQSKVIAKGSSGDKDEFNADTPYAIKSGGTVRLWYMGAPASALTTYGLAERMLIATAAGPEGPFTKSTTDVLLPSTAAAWDYGWMGGIQIRRRPNGTYMMIYNAGDTRPSTAGSEPDTSRVGYAYSASLDGPWTKDAGNPQFTPTGWPANGLESTNIWRTHLAWDSLLSKWFAFYNTGTGTEKITFGREGAYDYFDLTNAPSYTVLVLTTGVQTVTNSRVNVGPGLYRVRYAYNIGDLGTTKPAIDVDLVLRFNGTAVRPASREYIGNYNYENRDVVLEYIVPVAAAGYFDASVQVTNGTPTAVSEIRRQRITVERM